MSPNETRNLIRRYYDEVMNGTNLKFADELYLPTAIIHDPATPALPAGPDGIKQLVQTYRAAFPDCKYVTDQVIVEGDFAAVRWTATGTHKGTLFGIAPTGQFGTVTGISIHRFANNRIAEVWANWDVLGMLRSMGVELPIKTEAELTV